MMCCSWFCTLPSTNCLLLHVWSLVLFALFNVSVPLTEPSLSFCWCWRKVGHLETPWPKTENFWVLDIRVCLPSLHVSSPPTQTDEVLQLKVRFKDTSKTDYHVIIMIRTTAAISQHVPTISHTHTQEPLWRLFIVCKESKVHTVEFRNTHTSS